MDCSRPRILVAAYCLLASGLTGLSLSRSDFSGPLAELMPGQPYALDVRNGAVTCDLEFNDATRYVLIVSSLDDAGATIPVRMEAAPIEHIAVCPATGVPVLPGTLLRFASDSARAAYVSRRNMRGTPNAVRQQTEAAASNDPDGSPEPICRDFHLYVTDGPLDDPRQYARVEAQLVGEGDSVRVFLDRQQTVSELAPGLVDEIVRLMDQTVVPETARRFGRAADIDGDGRFAVLLTPWLGRLQGGRTSLGGFVRSGDFRDDLEPPFGSHCDVLYLNSNVGPGNHLHNLLAHEFVHAICFSQHLPNEEDWLNEAIAHQAEPGWTNLRHRIGAYLEAPHRYPLVVPDYFRAGLWRNHGCRGATFLFLRWCTDQFGDELLRKLIHNPVRGTRNLETITGVAFEDLYRHWTLSLLQSSLTTGGGRRLALEERSLKHDQQEMAAGRSMGGLSLDLAGCSSGRELVGPKRIRWNVPEVRDQRTIELRGTATAYFDLAAATPGIWRLRIAGRPDARLQVSLYKLE